MPGAQTHFRVCIARAETELRAHAAVVIPPRIRPAPRGRVLVIDDEEQIRKELRRMLGRQHEVVTVGSGKQARAVLEMDSAFHAILCDLMMPEITGMELYAWLLSHAPALAPRVIFMSGGAFTPLSATFLESVANPKLTKPFEAAEVKLLVEQLAMDALDFALTSTVRSQ